MAAKKKKGVLPGRPLPMPGRPGAAAMRGMMPDGDVDDTPQAKRLAALKQGAKGRKKGGR